MSKLVEFYSPKNCQSYQLLDCPFFRAHGLAIDAWELARQNCPCDNFSPILSQRDLQEQAELDEAQADCGAELR